MYGFDKYFFPQIQCIKYSPNPIPVNNGFLNQSVVIFGMVCGSHNLSYFLNKHCQSLVIRRGNGNPDYPRVKEDSKDLNYDLQSIGDHYKREKRASAKNPTFGKQT